MDKLHKLLQSNKKTSSKPAVRGENSEEFFSEVDSSIKRQVCLDVFHLGDKNEDSVKRGDLTTSSVFKNFYRLDKSLFTVGSDVRRFEDAQGDALRQASLSRHYKRLEAFEASPSQNKQPLIRFSVNRQLSKHQESDIRSKHEKLHKYEQLLQKESTNNRAAPEMRQAYQKNYMHFL